MKKLKIFTTVSIIGLLYSCSTTPGGRFDLSQRWVTIRTEPTAAKVTQLRPLKQAPLELGVTPLVNRSVSILTNIRMKNMPFKEAQELIDHVNNLVVRIEKDGYEPYRATLATKSDETTEYSIKLAPKLKNE